MRKCRTVETGRCYHLISRLAHRAFFLDDDEKTRAVDLMRRIEILRRINTLYRGSSLAVAAADAADGSGSGYVSRYYEVRPTW